MSSMRCSNGKTPLEPLYPILYLDAIVIKVQDGHQVQNRAAHIAVGVDVEGRQAPPCTSPQ